MTEKKSATKKPAFGSIVTYHETDRELAALVSAVDGDEATLTVFDPSGGSFTVSGAKHGSKDGCWS